MLMGHILIRLLIAMGFFKVSPELSDSPTWFCGAFSDRFLVMALRKRVPMVSRTLWFQVTVRVGKHIALNHCDFAWNCGPQLKKG